MAKQKTELNASAKADSLELRKIHERLQFGFLEGVADLGRKCQEKHDKYANHSGGTFLRVLSEAGIPKSTAYRAMEVAKSSLPSLGKLISIDAAYILTATTAPEAAEEEAIELAKAGETITPAKARAIVKKHTEPEPDEPEEESEPDPEAWLEPLQAPFKKAVKDINEALRVLGKLSEAKATGIYLAKAWSRFETAYIEIKTGLNGITPWADCPHCKHKGCKECGGCGWITKHAYNTLPQELRA